MKKVRIAALGLAVMALALVCVLLLSQELAAAPAGQAEAEISLANSEPSAAGATATAWSSGWITVTAGTCETLNHNLGGDPDDYGLEIWFLETTGNEGIHRKYYGGLEIGGRWRGAYWQHLESNTIQVCRGADDLSVIRLRVRVWELPEAPDFDSGWRNIGQGDSLTIHHGLDITRTELAVTLWFSGTARGIHHFAYGGLYNSETDKRHGAYWQRLTNNTIEVVRLPEDSFVEQVRVVVTRPDPPDYDSLVAEGGWLARPVSGEQVLSHALNWDPNLLIVRSECRSPTWGIHQRDAGLTFYDGSIWQGASIYNLTSNTVALTWGQNDAECDWARVRIWRRVARAFLPLLVKGP